MRVVPKISIRKKPLASSGMTSRTKPTTQAAGLPKSGRASPGNGFAAVTALSG
jgi:hypothetical protein